MYDNDGEYNDGTERDFLYGPSMLMLKILS